MDQMSRTQVEDERDGVVALLRTIADRLHCLTAIEAHVSLARLASPLALLAREAEPVVGPLPALTSRDGDPGPPPQRPTVVFVRRGAPLEA